MQASEQDVAIKTVLLHEIMYSAVIIVAHVTNHPDRSPNFSSNGNNVIVISSEEHVETAGLNIS